MAEVGKLITRNCPRQSFFSFFFRMPSHLPQEVVKNCTHATRSTVHLLKFQYTHAIFALLYTLQYILHSTAWTSQLFRRSVLLFSQQAEKNIEKHDSLRFMGNYLDFF